MGNLYEEAKRLAKDFPDRRLREIEAITEEEFKSHILHFRNRASDGEFDALLGNKDLKSIFTVKLIEKLEAEGFEIICTDAREGIHRVRVSWRERDGANNRAAEASSSRVSS